MASNFIVTGQGDLDTLFSARGGSAPAPTTGLTVGIGGQDLADRYHQTLGGDDIGFNTGFISAGTGQDLRYSFRSITSPSGPTITVQPVGGTYIEGNGFSISITVTPAGTPSYVWQKSNSGAWTTVGTNSSTYSVATSVRANQDTYRCLASDDSGTTTSNTCQIFINYLPVINTQPSGSSVNAGAAVSFSVSISEGQPSPATFQWQRNSINVSAGRYGGTATTGTLLFSCDSGDDSSTYRCLVTNAAGTVYSTQATLAVYYQTVIYAQPSHQNINYGGTLVFNVGAYGNTSPTYQWQKLVGSWTNVVADGTHVGGTTANYTITNSQAGDQAWYHCVMLNTQAGGGTWTTNTIDVFCNVNTAPQITSQPTGGSFNNNAQINLVIDASGQPTPTYQWQRSPTGYDPWTTLTSGTDGGKYGATATTRFLTFYCTQYDNGLWYRCYALNSQGQVYSDGVQLTVYYGPIFTGQPSDVNINQGATLNMYVSAYGNTNPTYQWEYSNNYGANWSNVAGQTSTTLSITNAQPGANQGHYRCAATNSKVGGTQTNYSNAAFATVYTNPYIISNPSPFTGHRGQGPYSLQCQGSGSGTVYFQWFRNSVSQNSPRTGNLSASSDQFVFNPIVSANAGQWYCQVTNSYGGTAANSSQVTVTVDTSPPTITVDPTGFNAAPNTGPYAVQCYASGDPTLYYQWFRNGNSQNSPRTGDLGGGDQFVFNPVDTGLGNWFCRVSNSYSETDDSATATVTMSGPTITENPSDVSGPDGSGPYAIHCSATGGQTLYFEWFHDSVSHNYPCVGNESATRDQHVFNIDSGSAGVWFCRVYNQADRAGSSADSGTATVTIT